MTHCPTLEELSALIDGELHTERELEIRWHLDMCQMCNRAADGVVALKRAVGRAHDHEAPSPALRRSVMARLPKHKRRWHWRAGAIAAPLFIAAAALLFCFGPSAVCADTGSYSICTPRGHGHVSRIVVPQCLRPEELPPVAESF
jgi:anti-sigma factor RsiW